MAPPTKEKAVERLRKVLNEIPALKKLSNDPPEFEKWYRDVDSPEFEKWYRDVRVTIANTFGDESKHLEEFFEVRYYPRSFSTKTPYLTLQKSYLRGLDSAAAVLESMISEIEEYWEEDGESSKNFNFPAKAMKNTKKVFVIHGHDKSAREMVARFLEKLQLEPVILHEQPNKGCTIVEKFIDYADVGFAIVLLTPDDVGALATNREELKPRARQNVILELGFFIGKLGRQRVAPFVKGEVETPSDYDGVVYTKLDDTDSWKIKLIQELKVAGFSIDANRVV